MSFQMGERLNNISERQNLVEFVKLPITEAIKYDFDKLRQSIANIAVEICDAGGDAEISTDNGNHFLWWESEYEEKAHCKKLKSGKSYLRF